MKKTELKKELLTLSVDDVKELLPNEEFKYEMYWDYRDEIQEDTFKRCMPDEKDYKDENGVINYENFINDWKVNIEDMIWDWNWDYIRDQIEEDLNDRVKKVLKDKGIEYDYLEYDFYPDDLYSVDLNLDEILSRSKLVWNVVRHNNFDGFTEGETEEDGTAIAQFLRLNPGLSTKEDLESMVNDCMYTGSDLKVNFKSSMLDFFNTIERGEIDLGGTDAVLHLSINGSGSPIFKLKEGVVKFGKKLESDFDYWDWELDGHYGVYEVYGCTMNEL